MDIKGIVSILRSNGVPEETISQFEKGFKSIQEEAKKSATDSTSANLEQIEKLVTAVGVAQTAMSKNMKDLEVAAGTSAASLANLRDEQESLMRQKQQGIVIDEEELRTINNNIKAREAELKAVRQKMIEEKSNQKVMESTNNFLKNQIGLGYELNDSFLGAMAAGNRSFASIATSVKQALQPQRLLASVLVQVQAATIDFAKALDTEGAALQKATGGAMGMNDGLVSMTTQNRRFNADIKTTSEVIKGLNDNISMFNQMSREQRDQLIGVNVRLKALGVSAENSGKAMDVMINSLGMSTAAAEGATLELVGLANATGMSADAIFNEMGSASSELAKYGKGMIKEFKAIAGAAEATGLSINSLMNITKQFDTFEGAAQHAGKLNAILGGGVINSMDLLNATEEERVRLLIQSINASGKNFENMNKFERQAIANAAGITDMNEAQKLFTQSLSEYDMQVEKAKGADKTNAEFEDMAAGMTSLQDKLSQIGKTFAITLGPLITGFSYLASAILFVTDTGMQFLNWIDGFIGGKGIVPMIVGIGMLVIAIKTARKMISSTVKSLAKDIGEGLGEGIEKVSEGASSGIKTFSKAMKKAAKPISSALKIIGKGAMSAAPGFAALGIALIKVGFGVALIVTPIALLVASMAMLIDSVIRLVKEVGGGELLKVAGAFYLFAIGIGQGLAFVSAAFMAFAATLVAVSYSSIGILPILTAGLIGVAAVVAALTYALLLLPNQKLINLSVASEGIAKVMDASVKLTPAAVEHTKEIVSAAADYVKVQAEMLAPDADAFVQALRGAFGGGGADGGQDIVLVLNDREFARAVNVAINKTNNLSID